MYSLFFIRYVRMSDSMKNSLDFTRIQLLVNFFKHFFAKPKQLILLAVDVTYASESTMPGKHICS